MTKKRLTQIEKRIEKIKAELAKTGAIRPGSLTLQFKDRKRRTGGFYQLSYTHEMKSRTNYIREDWLPSIRQQIKNYKRFKANNRMGGAGHRALQTLDENEEGLKD